MYQFNNTCYTNIMKKYEKIYNVIITHIENKKIELNELLPSEKLLCQTFDASRVTVRRALSELEKDGYIQKTQGKGSIVIRNSIKTKTVLLILPDIFQYIFVDMIKGIEETLRVHNISLLIANSFNNQAIERNIISNHIDMVDAIIFEPAQVTKTQYANSKTYSKLLTKPTICINSKIPDFNIPSLLLDDQVNMELVSNYVIDKQVKKILILAKTDDSQGFARLQGIKKSFKNTTANLKIVEFNTENENKKLDDFSFLFFHFKPDCLMFYNDEYASKFMSKYNINPIDENLIVTGFDNTQYSNGQPHRFISPNHPKGKMGVDAANMIINLLNNQQVESIIYSPDIDFDK